MFKLFFTYLVLFSTLGIFVSRVLLIRLGMEPNYLFMALGALVISALLVFRGALLILLVGIMTLGVNLPDDVLLNYGLDKDVLIAALLTMILFPLIYKVAAD